MIHASKDMNNVIDLYCKNPLHGTPSRAKHLADKGKQPGEDDVSRRGKMAFLMGSLEEG